MPQPLIQQYHPLHPPSFLSHVKSVLDALEKKVELKEEQVTEQERAAVHSLKALDACKVIIEGMNSTPIMYEPINVLMLAWKSRMTNKQ